MKIEDAITIATEAHRGQQDKGGQPYILHPLRLMLAAANHDERIVALLHDVIEDSDWTLDELLARGLSARQADALDAVTRRNDEGYDAFIRRAGADPLGRAVKILDLQDNSDLSRIAAPGEVDHARIEKYRRALALLLSS
ncbi:MAG: HD domain-containing protein [Paracoccus denitrificans]|uniref:HD domain-containing protein n=1 Tax=Paracoccus denitrificans TaxID=266 RepID=A0A533HZS7_PARDE|nr:MAG: HD domain-containing protein [Paracoccus denitrificans]